MVGADDFDLVIWMRKGACQASSEVRHVRCSHGASSKDSDRKNDLRTVWIDMSILHSNFMNFVVGKGWSFVGRGDDHGSPRILDGLVNSNVLASYLEFLLSFRSLANENESRWFVSIEEFTGVSDSAFSWNEFEAMSLDAATDDGGSADIRRFWAEHLPILMVVDGDYQFVGLGRTSGVVVHGIEPEFESVTTLADTFDEFLAASMRGQYDDLFFGRWWSGVRPQRLHAHEGCCDIRFGRSGAQSEAQSSSSTAMAYDTNGVIGDFAMGDVERQYALAGPCENGLRSLVGVNYSKRRFERLLFGPCSPFTGGVEVEDCKFISCSTDSTFSIAHGVRMRHVLFDDVRAPDAMLVSSATVLQDVIIRGGKKAAVLWCKPPSHGDVNNALLEWSKAEMANVKLAIDFSELSARDSEVVGIPLSQLRWNPEIHIPVSLSWRESAHWDELELSPRSYWRINLLRLQDFNCSGGVFTVPFPGDRNFDLKMEELARIEDAGILKR